MELISRPHRYTLLANGRSGNERVFRQLVPVTKLFSPDAGLTWLLAAMDAHDANRVWGLVDTADGRPRLAWDSLRRIADLRGRLGRAVLRDDAFDPSGTISDYAEAAARIGIVVA